MNWTPPTKISINVLEVTVISPNETIVDGVNCGNLCDAIANMPQFAAKFQQALEKAWLIMRDGGDDESNT